MLGSRSTTTAGVARQRVEPLDGAPVARPLPPQPVERVGEAPVPPGGKVGGATLVGVDNAGAAATQHGGAHAEHDQQRRPSASLPRAHARVRAGVAPAAVVVGRDRAAAEHVA
jgi:hypothetical protein